MHDDPSFFALFIFLFIVFSSDKIWQKILSLIALAACTYFYIYHPNVSRILSIGSASLIILYIATEFIFRKQIYNANFLAKKYLYGNNSLVNEASLKDISLETRIAHVVIFAVCFGFLIWLLIT
jgi:hypothetical protein